MNIYEFIQKLLNTKKYQVALNEYKKYIDENLSKNNFSNETFLKEIKGKKILLNLTSDRKINQIFCKQTIDYLRQKNIDGFEHYLAQCYYINSQFEILNGELDNIMDELKNNNQTMALYKILNSFENYNHKILNKKNEKPFSIFKYISTEKESLYESGVESLNIVLYSWYQNRGQFKKKIQKKKRF